MTTTYHGYSDGRTVRYIHRDDTDGTITGSELPNAAPDKSPTGFAWGYAGSGPAALAKSLLAHALPDTPAAQHPAVYQAFKQTYVASWPGGTPWTITGDDIAAWYRDNTTPEGS